MGTQFKIVYTGHLRPDADPNRVIKALTERLGLDRAKAERLVNSQHAVTMKRDLAEEKALKYQKALEKMGMVVRLEPMQVDPPPQQSDFDLDESGQTRVIPKGQAQFGNFAQPTDELPTEVAPPPETNFELDNSGQTQVIPKNQAQFGDMDLSPPQASVADIDLDDSGRTKVISKKEAQFGVPNFGANEDKTAIVAPDEEQPKQSAAKKAQFLIDDEPLPPELSVSKQPRCPKCRSTRIEGDNCLDCGIIISKYQGSAEPESEQASAAETNPYAAPQAELQSDMELELQLTGPHSMPIAHGWKWIQQGFGFFRQSPGGWILMLVVWFALNLVASLIPMLGPLATTLLTPVFLAGIVMGTYEQDNGNDFMVSHLFAGFSNQFGQLLLAGLLYLIGWILIMVLIFGSMFGTLMNPETMATQDPEMMINAMMPTMILMMLISLALSIPLVMAYWFAPALIILEGVSALTAMKLSFMGCIKNILPFLLYSILGMVFLILGMIPIGLGLLVVIPMMMASIYAAYKDIYYS